jgi:hypothetical protein
MRIKTIHEDLPILSTNTETTKAKLGLEAIGNCYEIKCFEKYLSKTIEKYKGRFFYDAS